MTVSNYWQGWGINKSGVDSAFDYFVALVIYL